MQIELHPSAQRTASGNTDAWIEPDLSLSSLIVNVSQISVNLLGSIAIKVQCSPDGTNWFDIPNLATGALSSTGSVSINLGSMFRPGDYLRLVWTFNNANSITFSAFIVGVK